MTGDNIEEIERLKKIIAGEFKIKDLRQLRYFSWNRSSKK